MTLWLRTLPIVVLLVAMSTPAHTQTTGRIVGQVVDSAGQPIPGVTVTVKSSRLQGVGRVSTDERGGFRFAFLPPASYDVEASKGGFKTVQTAGVTVELDRTATLRVRMEIAAMAESLAVTSGPSEIDVTNTASGINATADLYTRIPLGRSFLAVARVAPGTQEDEVGTAFYGSTGAENQYLIDGLNSTGTERGLPTKELNFDFVQEVEVKTGGLPAEYGRATGGVVNVLTKAGGNDFHGSGFGFFAGGALQSDNRTAPLRPADTTTLEDTASSYDFGAELGGRIVRDRLWFFAAYNRVATNTDTTVIRDLEARGAPPVAAVVSGDDRADRFAGKLTWSPGASSTLALSLFGDPGGFSGPIDVINGPPSTYSGTDESGGTSSALKYQATFGGSLLVQALVGRHREKRTFGGPGTDTPRLDDYTVAPFASTGGLGNYLDRRQTRDVAKLDASQFVGSHELKLGADIEAVQTHVEFFVSGGDYVQKLEQDGQAFYLHSPLIDGQSPGFVRDDPATWQPIGSFVSSPRTRNVSAYVQDAWRIRKKVVLNLGLRFERQKLTDFHGETAVRVANWAPRLNVAWDVRGDGRSKLFAGYGRYFESIPQLIGSRAFGGRTFANSYNFDPRPGSFAPDPGAPFASGVFGDTVTPVAAGIRGQYVDEWLLGFQRQLPGGFVIGTKVARRHLGRLIEDLNAGNGDYFFGNPGEGAASTLAFLNGSSAPCPRPQRNNDSLEFSARKRLSGGWQLLTSYLWSRLRGNYDGNYQRSTGEADPNWNSGFDYADFMVNASGPLTSESVHQWKVDGSYEFSGRLSGLNLGLSTHWFSGLPLNARGASFSYFDWEYYLVPRGTVRGRHPADYEIHLHASYPIRLSKRLRLQLQTDVFNLLDRQHILIYDERYNLIQDGPCAGVPEALCNGDGGWAARPGTLEPSGSLGDPRVNATNPDYLRRGTAFTGQRSVRLGLRLSI
jgi:hypothetical protein